MEAYRERLNFARNKSHMASIVTAKANMDREIDAVLPIRSHTHAGVGSLAMTLTFAKRSQRPGRQDTALRVSHACDVTKSGHAGNVIVGAGPQRAGDDGAIMNWTEGSVSSAIK